MHKRDHNLVDAEDVPLTLLAFGHPSHPATFSGYSCNLARVLRDKGLLRNEHSIRDLRPWDALSGAFHGRFSQGKLRFRISRSWMWSHGGNARLTKRLHKRLVTLGDGGPFLQIGTLVPLQPELGLHYVLTDMTIPQAKRMGYFDVADLPERELQESIGVQRKVLHNARAVFTLSAWAKESVVRDFGLDPGRVEVVHAGSNLMLPENLAEKRNPREILFVGIDWERKGGDILIKALRLLRERLPDVRLTIVGCRPPVREEGVTIEGFLDRRNPLHAEKLARCYLRAGCFCLPSLFDPFPNAIIEASSVGLPSVAIDNGSRREAIIDGVTGRLAPRRTSSDVAEALYWVLENDTRRRQLGEAAKTHASRSFTWDHVIARIQKTIRNTGR